MNKDFLRDLFLFDDDPLFEPFTDEEMDAIDKKIPMTQVLFNQCIEKCFHLPTEMDNIFYELIDDYPDFLNVYGESLEREMKLSELDDPYEISQEEIMEGYQKLCQRIRDRYGDDAI